MVGIRYGIVNKLFKLHGEQHYKLMCSAIRFGIFPNIHKIAGLKLIPKAGKDTSTAEGFRLMSKINCMGKVFEYFIAAEIEHELSGKGGLSDRQYGFRKGHNTEEAITLVTNKIERLRHSKIRCLCRH